jgi:hypothetical protein
MSEIERAIFQLVNRYATKWDLHIIAISSSSAIIGGALVPIMPVYSEPARSLAGADDDIGSLYSVNSYNCVDSRLLNNTLFNYLN